MTKVPAKVTVLAAILLASTLGARPAAAGEVIDRIVATVNGRIILQSDWTEALRYEALLSARTVRDFNSEERRAVLDQLIDQELLGEQMNSAPFKHASEQEAYQRLYLLDALRNLIHRIAALASARISCAGPARKFDAHSYTLNSLE